MIPAHSTTKGEQTPSSPTLAWTQDPPHPHLIGGTGSPTLWSQQENMLLVFIPSGYKSRGANKAWPEFLVWFLVNFS